MNVKGVLLYLRLSRPAHWIKNIIIVPGFLFAYALTPQPSSNLFIKLVILAISVCCISSANYVLNEWLDKDFDRVHPVKKLRPTVVYQLQPGYIFLEYVIFAIIGLTLALFLSIPIFIVSGLFLVMGIIYNLKPIRTKDIIYLDVITEAINNPIRLILGWLIVTGNTLPPTSLLFAFWLGGAYVMSIKRYAELQVLKDPVIASSYRKSFKYYSNGLLLGSAIFYAIAAMVYWSIFIANQKIELTLLLPFYSLLFFWYFLIGLKPNSVAQHPQYFYKEKKFTVFSILIVILTVLFY